mmetsp:Transcript_37002/g.66581  ORF Transcript_37002/g.66581 Transcript_37002/m.66581 type:complete len:130 (+) Transcript_37002:97-486(+)|eukprot:CAMPEP_0201884224 /NCGR_PEP_ID=MMETSP0902-20130614/16759_1 /ASSEMBLY_ACC=CAM_ASM_000551 /TAXON_ID=420261 /ORGANISM="Thalassiosira antarctica, Strain CCMP982" /LENGTH=129 /DNA_ID=CAMNT_0048413141 /DNA_START=49 /DNA_END=438 /DNA_ORIENTATION=-
MKAILVASALLLSFVAGGTQAEGSDNIGCPTDDTISKACLDAVTPPFPICLTKGSAKEWVAHAKDSATRCCGDNIDQCKCPVKNGQKFQEKIVGYCAAVGNCETQEATAGNLRGGFDMEHQVQREEYTP